MCISSGILKVAKLVGAGSSTVQRVKRSMLRTNSHPQTRGMIPEGTATILQYHWLRLATPELAAVPESSS